MRISCDKVVLGILLDAVGDNPVVALHGKAESYPGDYCFLSIRVLVLAWYDCMVLSSW